MASIYIYVIKKIHLLFSFLQGAPWSQSCEQSCGLSCGLRCGPTLPTSPFLSPLWSEPWATTWSGSSEGPPKLGWMRRASRSWGTRGSCRSKRAWTARRCLAWKTNWSLHPKLLWTGTDQKRANRLSLALETRVCPFSQREAVVLEVKQREKTPFLPSQLRHSSSLTATKILQVAFLSISETF